MTTLQIIIACGIISVVVSVLSILVSTSYGCDWLIQWWQRGLSYGRLGKPSTSEDQNFQARLVEKNTPE